MAPVFSKENVALVHKLAHLIWRRYTYLEAEDLIQSGFVGLLRAEKKYDPKHGASFKTYAIKRILGEILDGVRRGKPGIRRLSQIRRTVREATTRIEAREQRPATGRDLAAEVANYYLISQELEGIDPTGITEDIADGNDTEENAHTERELGKIEGRLKRLTPKEEKALRLYYIEGIYLHEVGRQLGGLSEARASQIVSGARKKLCAGDS